MEKENEFKPKVIGLPDAEKEAKIRQLYQNVCMDASATVYELEDALEIPEIELNVFFDFLHCEDPEKFIYEKFCDLKKPSFPGLSLAKIIENRLIDIPELNGELFSFRKDLLKLIAETRIHQFYISLQNLWDPENRGFSLNELFESQLYNHVRKFTKTEKENETLEAIESLIEKINDLVVCGILRNEKTKWETDLQDLIRAMVYTRNEERPLSLKPRATRLQGLRKHFEDRGFELRTGKPDDILSMISNQTEDIL